MKLDYQTVKPSLSGNLISSLNIGLIRDYKVFHVFLSLNWHYVIQILLSCCVAVCAIHTSEFEVVLMSLIIELYGRCKLKRMR